MRATPNPSIERTPSGRLRLPTVTACRTLGNMQTAIAPPLPSLRLAATGEAPAVLACVSAAFEMYIDRIGKPPAPMLLDYPKLIKERSVWVAELAGEIEGVLVQFETPDGFYIDTVASSPRARGTGIGRALLQFAEREATRRGYASVYLCTNSKMTENQVFYPSIGYVEYERKSDAGYDRVFYRKSLA